MITDSNLIFTVSLVATPNYTESKIWKPTFCIIGSIYATRTTSALLDLAERSSAIHRKKTDKCTSVAHVLGGGALFCGGGEKSKYEKFINTSKCGNDILVE